MTGILHTGLSDLSIVGTCDILVYQMGHKVVICLIGRFNLVIDLHRHMSLKPFYDHAHFFVQNVCVSFLIILSRNTVIVSYSNHCYGLATMSPQAYYL